MLVNRPGQCRCNTRPDSAPWQHSQGSARPCPVDMAHRVTVATISQLPYSRPGARCQRTICQAVGKCFIVGAGPGAVDLLTIRAAKLIQQADCIVYDDLGAQAAVQQYAAPVAERLYVGKRGGKASSTKQVDIDAMLVDRCLQGLRVVRLKGGCPSLFSRVSSELAALADAGVEVEMVPGISSPLAAPILAGFPLTDVRAGSAVAFITGHDPESISWSSFIPTSTPTICILMGGTNLAIIVDKLIKTAGWPATTPVAILKAAGTAQHYEWRSHLQDVVDDTQGAVLSPCIIVIGAVTGGEAALAKMARNVGLAGS